LTEWVALDDDTRDWPEEATARLIATDRILGVSASEPKKALETGLTHTAPKWPALG
jgi:hypothetical protein